MYIGGRGSSKRPVVFGTVCWGIPVAVLNFAGFLLTSGKEIKYQELWVQEAFILGRILV